MLLGLPGGGGTTAARPREPSKPQNLGADFDESCESASDVGRSNKDATAKNHHRPARPATTTALFRP